MDEQPRLGSRLRTAHLIMSRQCGLRLNSAAHGSFTLTPSDRMRDAFARDYEAMSGMILSMTYLFNVTAGLEQRLNSQLTN